MFRRGRGDLVRLWVAFGLAHAWLAYLGVVVVPAESFHDVDLYRYWVVLGLYTGQWPVLDDAWVYPAGALIPMLLVALAGATTAAGYAVGWCLLVTLIDGWALAGLLRFRTPDGAIRTVGAWWWLAFLVLLGPVAIGRLDAIIAPLMILALLAGIRHPRVGAALLAAGAWVKVAPGAVLLPLAVAARRPLRDAVVPAAAVSVAIAATVAALGGWRHLLSFLSTQQVRGLQVESVATTPWVLASLRHDDVAIGLNQALVTWEVTGPGTVAAARVLDVVLVLGVGAVAALLWRVRQEGRAECAVVPGALALLAVLIVANKVGSPQFMTWLAAPVAVLVAVGVAGDVTAPARGRPQRWIRAVAGLVLVAAGLTQVVFPWGYLRLLTGDPLVTAVLVARNVLLVALLATAVVGLVRLTRPPPPCDAASLRDGEDHAAPTTGGIEARRDNTIDRRAKTGEQGQVHPADQ